MKVPLHVKDRHSTEGKRDLAEFALQMAQLNPKGFRTPGRNGTSLVMRRSLEAGLADMTEVAADQSHRQEAKRARRDAYLADCRKQRETTVKVGGVKLTGDAALRALWNRKVANRQT